MFMLEVGELRAGSSLPTPVPVFVPKVTLKEEGVAGSGEMHFIAGGCLASGLSRERSFNADQRSLPHREGPALSVLPDPELQISHHSSPRVLVLSTALGCFLCTPGVPE